MDEFSLLAEDWGLQLSGKPIQVYAFGSFACRRVEARF